MKIFSTILIALFLGLANLTHAQTDKQALIDQVLSNTDKVESLRLIQRVGGYNPDYQELNTLFKQMDRKVKKSTDGKIFARYLKALKASSVGQKAPGITQFDSDGLPYSLSDLKGKYVLLDFWASWCSDCKKVHPELVEIYNDFKGPNFEILGISLDKERAPWVKEIEEGNLDWKHISDLQGWNSSASQIYAVKAVPQNILVDPEGKIIARNIYGAELSALLKEVLY